MDLSLDPTDPLLQPPYPPTAFLLHLYFFLFFSLPFPPLQFSSHPSSSGCPLSLPLSLTRSSLLFPDSPSPIPICSRVFLPHSPSTFLSQATLKHDKCLSFSPVQGRSPTNAMRRDAHGNSPGQMSSTDIRENTAGSDPTCVPYATGILHDLIT